MRDSSIKSGDLRARKGKSDLKRGIFWKGRRKGRRRKEREKGLWISTVFPMKSNVSQMHVPAIHLSQSPKSGKTRYKRSRNTPQTRSISQITQSQHKKHTQNHPRMSLDRLKNIKYPFRNRDRHIENSRELFLVGRRGQSVKALEPDLKIGVWRIYLRLVVSPRYLNRQDIMFLLWSARVAPHSISRELWTNCM